MSYQKFETQAIYQAIHDLGLWLIPHVGKECLRSWFAHLGHADTYRLRLKLWREAKPVLGEFVC